MELGANHGKNEFAKAKQSYLDDRRAARAANDQERYDDIVG